MNPTYLPHFYDLAVRAHGLQTRDNGYPFILHPIAVAKEVSIAIADLPDDALYPYKKEQVVAIAVLHDVPEDCTPEWGQAIKMSDPLVHKGAMQLRNPSKDHENLPREQRKRMDRNWYADPLNVDDAMIIIKYKDRIHNVKETVDWKPKRRTTYMEESRLLKSVLASRLSRHEYISVRHLGLYLEKELLEEIKKIEALT